MYLCNWDCRRNVDDYYVLHVSTKGTKHKAWLNFCTGQLFIHKSMELKDFNKGVDQSSVLTQQNNYECCLMLISSMSKIRVPRVEPSPFASRVGLNIVVNSLCRSKNCTKTTGEISTLLCPASSTELHPSTTDGGIYQAVLYSGYFLNPSTPMYLKGIYQPRSHF